MKKMCFDHVEDTVWPTCERIAVLHSKLKLYVFVLFLFQLTKTPVRTPEYEDTKVQPNKEYEYRVSAINEAGPSAPSAPSKPIAAKPAKGVSLFDLTTILV